MSPIVLTAIGVGGSTVLGSALGFFIKGVSHRANDIIIGFCAGMMLSASVLGLIVPAFAMDKIWSNVWLPCLGIIAGVVILNLLDYLTPHLHHLTGIEQEEHRGNEHLNRVLLFIMAIALHKFPEGMAAGVGFGGEEITQEAFGVAIAISLQNIPEGMVIISPLILAGVSRWRTFVIAIVISMLEVLGVFAGYTLGSFSAAVLPFMLALAGGAMLYVVSDEMIPESHAHGYQKPATYALIAGFVIMLLIDKI